MCDLIVVVHARRRCPELGGRLGEPNSNPILPCRIDPTHERRRSGQHRHTHRVYRTHVRVPSLLSHLGHSSMMSFGVVATPPRAHRRHHQRRAIRADERTKETRRRGGDGRKMNLRSGKRCIISCIIDRIRCFFFSSVLLVCVLVCVECVSPLVSSFCPSAAARLAARCWCRLPLPVATSTDRPHSHHACSHHSDHRQGRPWLPDQGRAHVGRCQCTRARTQTATSGAAARPTNDRTT